MASPWVQRMVKEQERTGRKASLKVDGTLGDSVPADRVCYRAATSRDCPAGHKYVGSTPLRTPACR